VGLGGRKYDWGFLGGRAEGYGECLPGSKKWRRPTGYLGGPRRRGGGLAKERGVFQTLELSSISGREIENADQILLHQKLEVPGGKNPGSGGSYFNLFEGALRGRLHRVLRGKRTEENLTAEVTSTGVLGQEERVSME